MQNKTKDNRAYSRFGLDVAVELHSEAGPGLPAGSTMVCRTRDISLEGMCIYTETPLAHGTHLLLNIELGTPPRQFHLMGEVIWSSPDSETGMYKTGIHLTRLPGDKAAWHAAVLQQLIG